MAMPNIFFTDEAIKKDIFCSISGYIGSETLFLIFYAKLMLTNYHHKILNEPDRNYSFYRDKTAISMVILFFIVAIFFSVYPFSSTETSTYGQSLGEGGYCYTTFDI